LREHPLGFVRDDPVAEVLVFLAVRGEHADEATAALVNVHHVRPRRQLHVGDIEEVPPAGERDEFLPRLDVGARVVGVPIHRAVRDRHRAIGAHREDPQQLLQVRVTILVVPMLDGERRSPGLRAPISLHVRAAEGDGRRIVVKLREVDLESAHRVEHQAREQAAAIGVEQALECATDPIIVQQRPLRRRQAQQGGIERACPLAQAVQRRVLQHQVTDHHPQRPGVRQAHPPVSMRDEPLE